MCGIAGVVGLQSEVAGHRMAEALRRMVHRGPDGSGALVLDGVAIGMRRLAIIDLAGGDQPIFNEDRSIAVVCNGELYNYCELFSWLRNRGHWLQSESDVNVLPHLYEEYGTEAIAHVRGMFGAALWDATRRRLVLWRDRVGKKPLFYAQSGGGLAFASELPALLALLDRQPDLDVSSLRLYLQLGFVPHPWTIYQGVHALPPGHCLEWSEDEGGTARPYWARRPRAPFGGTREEAQFEVSRLLDEAVRLRLRSDVPVGLFLSGGIDSGLVAAAVARLGTSDLKCFTVEVEDHRLNEAPAAIQVAEHLGLEVETIPLHLDPAVLAPIVASMYGQPFGDSSAVPSYVVSQAARKHRKVVLNGDGGDEVFAGYRRYLASQVLPWCKNHLGIPARAAGWFGSWLGRRVARRTAAGFLARTLRGAGQPESDRYLTWTTDLLTRAQVNAWFPGLSDQAATEASNPPMACHDLRSMLQTDFELILPADLLVKMDVATMANGLEARSPFLDTDLVECAWSLPDEWLVDGLTTKPLLRSMAATQLPAEIVGAPKRGFEVPVSSWLAGPLRPLLAETLLSREGRVAEFTAPGFLTSLVNGSSAFAGNRAQLTWALLMLELFLRAPAPTVAGGAWT